MDSCAILEQNWAQLLYTIALTVDLVLLQRQDLQFVDVMQVENGMAVFHDVTAVCYYNIAIIILIVCTSFLFNTNNIL